MSQSVHTTKAQIMSLFAALKSRLLAHFDWIKAKLWPPPHPTTMSTDEIAEELDRLLEAPYSRANQRRAAMLTKYDDEVFGQLTAEDIFEFVIKSAMRASLLIGGEPSTVAHSYASYMLFRICTVGASITELYRSHEREPLATLDYSSIAVLSRTIIDASVMYWYLTEEVSDDEWKFRQMILSVHDASSRVRLFKGFDPEQADTQRKALERRRKQLSKLDLFKAKTLDEQQMLLSGKTMYVNGMRSLLKPMNVGKVYFDGLYNYLSAHVHLTPLSYFATRNGTLQEVRHARNFMGLCLHEAARFAVRVVLREIEISKLEKSFDPKWLDQIKRIAAPGIGAA
jgi:hypothetical protein